MILPTEYLAKFNKSDFLLPLAWYVGYLILMVTVPYHIPVADGVTSGASLDGYNSSIAYNVAIAWSVLGILLFAVKSAADKNRSTQTSAAAHELNLRKYDRHDLVEISVVFLVCILLYFPVFLAKSGPFIEDSLMLSILHRMQGGQAPFTDFKFLYSPLMIYPLHAWVSQFGYSMVTYYTYLALLVGFQFSLLIAIVQRFFPRSAIRYIVFFLIASFLVETLLGTNWNGTRRLIPIVALLLISIAPLKTSTVILAGTILGFMLAYSHDFGVAGLIGVIAVYGLGALRENFRKNFLACAGIGAIASTLWLFISLAVLGDSFSDYIETVMYLVGRYSIGEAGFRFYWTLNSLAVFGIVWLACITVARGIPGCFRKCRLEAGDRLMLASLAYSFVILKSGLNRCDFWHLNAAIIPLLFAFLLPLPRNMFVLTGAGRHLSRILIIVAAATYLIGSLPSGSYYFKGYLQGIRNTFAPQNERITEPFRTAAPSLLWESGLEPNPSILSIARFLAEEPYFGRPVLFYLDTWGLDKYIGVYRTEYQVDDLVFSDDMGFRIRDYLENKRDAFVVMSRPSYERLFGLRDPADFSDYLWMLASLTKRIAAITSSVHYEGVIAERKALEARMNRTVGPYIKEHFAPLREFGNYILLKRSASSAASAADWQ